MRICGDFALLDVKHGRVGLNRRFFDKPDAEPVEVTITGRVTGIWGHDDGESQEFEVQVDKIDTSSTGDAVSLLKSAQRALGDGGLRSIASGGWGSCSHCGGHPDHKYGCIVARMDEFLGT